MSFWTVVALNVVQPIPVLWLSPQGQVLVDGRPAQVRSSGVRTVRSAIGAAFDFSGPRGGILLGDPTPLALGGSMTVAGWIYARSYVNDGSGGQILFRGDDRNGFDSYWFDLEGDGTINFSVSDSVNHGAKLKVEFPLKRWIHVVANFDAEEGAMNMWFDCERVAYVRTTAKPYVVLDRAYTPGVGIGNVQNDHGPHNQPFNGIVADLRLYNVALTPDRIQTGMPRITEPPLLLKRYLRPDRAMPLTK